MDAQGAPIGKIIKRARERMRLSQAEAAVLLGVSRSALNAWENGRASPRSSIGALEELYGISLDPEPGPGAHGPSQEELEDLRGHVREVLGHRAAQVEAAIDAALSGAPRARRAAAASAPSGRQAPTRRSG